jgi:hypothetical protein
MALSRKYYKAIADELIAFIVHNYKSGTGDTDVILNIYIDLIQRFCDYFKSDNIRFDREKFKAYIQKGLNENCKDLDLTSENISY